MSLTSADGEVPLAPPKRKTGQEAVACEAGVLTDSEPTVAPPAISLSRISTSAGPAEEGGAAAGSAGNGKLPGSTKVVVVVAMAVAAGAGGEMAASKLGRRRDMTKSGDIEELAAMALVVLIEADDRETGETATGNGALAERLALSFMLALKLSELQVVKSS